MDKKIQKPKIRKIFLINDMALFERQLENKGEFGCIHVQDVLSLLEKYKAKDQTIF